MDQLFKVVTFVGIFDIRTKVTAPTTLKQSLQKLLKKEKISFGHFSFLLDATKLQFFVADI